MVNRFYNIRDTILIFLEEHKEFELSRFFHKNNFVQTISYYSDIFPYFNNVNLVLKDNDTDIISLSNQIDSLKNKITLWINLITIINNNYSVFPNLNGYKDNILIKTLILSHHNKIKKSLKYYFPEDLSLYSSPIASTFDFDIMQLLQNL